MARLVRKTTRLREALTLPDPRRHGPSSVEEALLHRRSVREFRDRPLPMASLSQLLWAAQGVTSREGFRTAPSAGALYPLEISVVVGNVTGLAAGVYRYEPRGHALRQLNTDDRRETLRQAAFDQSALTAAPMILVISAVPERTTAKYGQRGTGYVYMEAGHTAQNVYLQAVGLGLGTVVVGAFDDGRVKKALGLPARELPLYLMPVGTP